MLSKKACHRHGHFDRDRPGWIVAMSTLPISQYPDITPPTVVINSNYIGADAQTVEQTTTTTLKPRSTVHLEWFLCRVTAQGAV
jgi:hypothetical protein